MTVSIILRGVSIIVNHSNYIIIIVHLPCFTAVVLAWAMRRVVPAEDGILAEE